MLLDTDRGPLDIESEAYEISIPKPGWAEEDPNRWWSALKSVLARMKLAQPTAFAAIESIGFSGQMHGFVALDAEERPVYPAIIWVDQRSKRQVEEIESAYSFEELARTMHNHVFTGFGFPSLLWLKQELPEVFARIHRICAPKDYLRLLLIGGEAETETSDASSMTGFDFTHRDWNRDVLERFGFVTLVECVLETGRTHQIRAHMKHIGYPLFADARYGGDQILRGNLSGSYRQFVKGCMALCPRQALHARTLGFRHPRTGQEMDFEVPLPPDMAALVERWRNFYAARAHS